MSAVTAGGAGSSRAFRSGQALDVVHAVLQLLEELPDPPNRIRMRAGDVTVDLDWRSPSAPPMAYEPSDPGRQHALGSVGTSDPAPQASPAEPKADGHSICSP